MFSETHLSPYANSTFLLFFSHTGQNYFELFAEFQLIRLANTPNLFNL